MSTMSKSREKEHCHWRSEILNTPTPKAWLIIYKSKSSKVRDKVMGGLCEKSVLLCYPTDEKKVMRKVSNIWISTGWFILFSTFKSEKWNLFLTSVKTFNAFQLYIFFFYNTTVTFQTGVMRLCFLFVSQIFISSTRHWSRSVMFSVLCSDYRWHYMFSG